MSENTDLLNHIRTTQFALLITSGILIMAFFISPSNEIIKAREEFEVIKTLIDNWEDDFLVKSTRKNVFQKEIEKQKEEWGEFLKLEVAYKRSYGGGIFGGIMAAMSQMTNDIEKPFLFNGSLSFIDFDLYSTAFSNEKVKNKHKPRIFCAELNQNEIRPRFVYNHQKPEVLSDFISIWEVLNLNHHAYFFNGFDFSKSTISLGLRPNVVTNSLEKATSYSLFKIVKDVTQDVQIAGNRNIPSLNFLLTSFGRESLEYEKDLEDAKADENQGYFIDTPSSEFREFQFCSDSIPLNPPLTPILTDELPYHHVLRINSSELMNYAKTDTTIYSALNDRTSDSGWTINSELLELLKIKKYDYLNEEISLGERTEFVLKYYHFNDIPDAKSVFTFQESITEQDLPPKYIREITIPLKSIKQKVTAQNLLLLTIPPPHSYTEKITKGEFASSFPNLNEVTKNRQEYSIKDTDNFLLMEQKRNLESKNVDLFGIKIPLTVVYQFGIFVLFSILSYEFLHLSTLVNRAKVQEIDWDYPWIGLYESKIAKSTLLVINIALPLLASGMILTRISKIAENSLFLPFVLVGIFLQCIFTIGVLLKLIAIWNLKGKQAENKSLTYLD